VIGVIVGLEDVVDVNAEVAGEATPALASPIR
jgi:hypothetical protein